MHLCFEQDPDVRPNASQIRDILEELWYRNDIWDTTLWFVRKEAVVGVQF